MYGSHYGPALEPSHVAFRNKGGKRSCAFHGSRTKTLEKKERKEEEGREKLLMVIDNIWRSLQWLYLRRAFGSSLGW